LNLILASAGVMADPRILMKQNGVSTPVWLMREDNKLSRASQDETRIEIDHAGGVQLGRKDNMGAYHPDSYYNTGNLLGGSVKMTVDLYQMECGCNAGISLVAAPG